jgi:hypothetical protein
VFEGAFSFERNERNMINNKRAAIMEKKQEIIQQRLEAGSVATNFPEVANIIMNMTYTQTGSRSILRTFNFTPNSDAFFLVNCLRQNCVDGGFDLTQVITTMIRNHKAKGKGELSCTGTDPSTSHSDIVYEVAIQYT